MRSATLTRQDHIPWLSSISIHALHAECDRAVPAHISDRSADFNPRTPCGVRHGKEYVIDVSAIISIHALHAECDKVAVTFTAEMPDFNPRTPCGVRPSPSTWASCSVTLFQSTHSMRSATLVDVLRFLYHMRFQSTHSMRSATLSYWTNNCLQSVFQSTHSMRSATKTKKSVDSLYLFQSTHSMRSATGAKEP